MNQKLENVQVQLNQTTINCGTINGIAPSEEANTINLAYSKINSQAIPSLTLFIDKKPEIDKVVLLSNVTAARIGQLDQKSKALNARLVTKIPATHLEALNGYIAEIENQLEMVKVAYGTK
jgi:hypothetical protein